MPKPPPAAVIALTQKARNAVRSLERKMAPPSIALLDFVGDLWSFQIVYALAELGVADQLAGGTHTAAEVARAVGADEDHLYRLMRAATNIDLLEERPGRAFALRPIGEALIQQEGESFRDFIVFMGKVGWRTWGRLTDSIRQGKTAIELEFGKKPFEYLTGDPEVAHLFNRAMTAVSALAGDAFVAAYDTSRLRRIVDVGGGHGRLLASIIAATPDARGVLCDMPSVVAGAPPILAKYNVEARIDVEGGDFFQSVPSGGDLYVMKSVIHDWQDTEAAKILASIRRAATPTSKLALYETVVPGPNDKHFAKFLDLEMIVHGGGRERTRDEYAALLTGAGFRMTRVIRTAGPMSIVEALPA